MSGSRMAAVGLVAVASVVAALVWQRLPAAEPAHDYAPVPGSTALDSWQASWPATEPAAGATEPPRRWIVMGWDGASWEIALPLIAAGRLPHLARLMREGSYGELRTFVPTLSAAIWTSVATGVTPARHGIEGFSHPNREIWPRLRTALGGKPPVRLYSNADRRRKALWNLASEAGRQVLVVGYHNTFPAEKLSGAMLSNYLARQAWTRAHPGESGGEASTVVAHAAYPAQILRRVASLEPRLDDLRHEDVSRFAQLDAAAFRRRMADRNPRGTSRWDYLLKAYAFDTFHGRVALALREELDPDLLMLHFQGPDWAGHYFLYFHAPERFAGLTGMEPVARRLDRERALYRDTVAAFYEYTDEWLGRLLEGVGPTTGVAVLSDHGMEARADAHEPGFHNDGPPGLLVLWGPGIRHGHRISGATVYDILPTLAACMGLPVARDLDGRVLRDAFAPGLLDPERLAAVDSYDAGGRFAPDVPLDAPFQEQLEEELRGLGYIQ